MAEDKKSVDGIIEKLALITDATQTLFPNGKSVIIFELNYDDYKKVQSNFRQIDSGYKQFKIDLSDVEVIFILENTIKELFILNKKVYAYEKLEKNNNNPYNIIIAGINNNTNSFFIKSAEKAFKKFNYHLNLV